MLRLLEKAHQSTLQGGAVTCGVCPHTNAFWASAKTSVRMHHDLAPCRNDVFQFLHGGEYPHRIRVVADLGVVFIHDGRRDNGGFILLWCTWSVHDRVVDGFVLHLVPL